MDAKTRNLSLPLCKGAATLERKEKRILLPFRHEGLPVIDGIPCMVPTEAREMKEEEIEELDKK